MKALMKFTPVIYFFINKDHLVKTLSSTFETYLLQLMYRGNIKLDTVGDLKSGYVHILQGQKEVGLQNVQILNGI